MARTTPRTQEDRLILIDGRALQIGSAAWFAWLEEATTFGFTGAAGTFTARRERGGRSGWYWKAYRMRGGTLRRAYLGRSADLTYARLQAAAIELAEQEPGAGGQHTDTASGCAAPGDPPLASKSCTPRAPTGLIERPRLIEQLHAGARRKLILLSAPAGSGKTTLLSAWLHGIENAKLRIETNPGDTPNSQFPILNSQFKVAWVSLEAGDNDPIRFWSYITAALDRIAPGVGAAALPVSAAAQASTRGMWTGLLNALSTLATETLLVLDDYHVIDAPEIHQAMSVLIERMPGHMHLVIATRADPPLPLTRLRARGELAELRAADLRFALDEASAFLNGLPDLALSADDVATLVRRTEGWITGLQLAAFAMRGRSNPGEFVAAFQGSNRFVMDYLADEVLGRLPLDLQRFVLQTSILDRMCGPLCDSVLGLEAWDLGLEPSIHTSPRPQTSSPNQHSRLILEQLERANLFIVPLDDERRWYRYHQLFAEAARARLRATTSDADVATLHARTSAWYERQERGENTANMTEAIRHALAARDWQRAGDLVEQHGLLIATRGLAPEVCVWIDTIPDALARSRPLLCLCHAIALMFTNRLDSAEGRLRDAERGIGPGTSDNQALPVLTQVALARANLARCVGDLDRCVALSRQVMLLPSATPTIAQAGAMLNLARAYQLTGDAGPAAERLAEQAVAQMRAAGNLAGTLAGIVNLAQLHRLQGRLRTAAQIYSEAAQLTALSADQHMLIGGPGHHFGFGHLLYERNDLAAAEEHLRRGMEIMGAGLIVDADVIARGYQAFARLQQARGDSPGARATLDSLTDLARRRGFVPVAIRRTAALQAQLALQHGDLATAARWADVSGLGCADSVSYPYEQEYLTLARVRIIMGRAEPASSQIRAAVELLDRLLVAADAGARTESVIEILLVRALALQALGNLAGALVSLARALVLAAPEGYVRVFVDEGAPMLDLLRAAYARGIAPGFVEQLLAAFPDCRLQIADCRLGPEQSPTYNPSATLRTGLQSAMVEALTARELEVVRLMASGASNRAIAERLTLSIGTVKRYANNIFSKLDVQSRTQAIAKARALRML